MDDPIPVTLLCGPHDELRLRAAAWLARNRVPQARWALLRTGVLLPLPAEAWPAGLARYDAGAACGCCIGQVALRLTLARLLRDARRLGAWQALLIDAGAAADPCALAAALQAPPFAGYFALRRRVAVLDPAAAAPVLDGPPGLARARLVAQLGSCEALLAPQCLDPPASPVLPGGLVLPTSELPAGLASPAGRAAPTDRAGPTGLVPQPTPSTLAPRADDPAEADLDLQRNARTTADPGLSVDTALATVLRAAPHLVDLEQFS